MKPAKCRILKYLILSGISSFIIIIAAAAIFFYFFPEENLRKLIISNIEESLNCRITIDNIDLSIRGIVLKDVALYGNSPDENEIIMNTEYVYLGFSFLPLLKKEIQFNNILLSNFRINIIYDEKGVTNLEKLIKDNSKKKESSATISINLIKLDNGEISLQNAPPHLAPLEGAYKINSSIRIDKNDTIHITNSKITLPEARGTVYPEIDLKITNGNFEITGSAGLENISMNWIYRWPESRLPYKNISGKVENILITGEAVEGKAELTSTFYKSKKTCSVKGFYSVNITDRYFELRDIAGKINATKVSLKNLKMTFDNDLINLNIDSLKGSISDIKLIVDIIPPKLYGNIEGTVEYGSNRLNSELNINNFGYDYRNGVIKGLKASVSIKNNIFKEENIPLRILNNPSYVSIASTDGSLKKIFLNIISDNFNISDKTQSNGSSFSLKMPFEIAGRIKINRFSYNPVKINNINIDYSYKKNSITIKRFLANFMDGDFQGSGTIIAEERLPRAYLSLTFDRVKIQNLSEISDKFRNRAYGIAEGRIKINFLISYNIINTLNGNAEIKISKGKFVDTGIQNGLGIWLSELKYKLRDLEFDKIYGNINIDRNNYSVNSFILQSSDKRLRIKKGRINTKLIASRLNLNLEFNNQFIQELTPAFILGLKKYKSGKWYIIPFEINGDISNSKNIKLLK